MPSNIWMMFWAWLVISFGLWLFAGRLAWKFFSAMPAPRGSIRALSGAVLLLLGLVVLCGLFVFLTSTNQGGRELSPLQMAATTIAGAIFAITQTAAAAAMLSNVEPMVTNLRRPPSIIENQEGKDS